ncbi:MAG: type II toxin-antitoxin system RelE/ParE family toxin [Alphaproteobacteria bacterium]|nr:type II toxin-antitoxin system RelE/ParE family toxin [Alphaproteobacteria bacterium]
MIQSFKDKETEKIWNHQFSKNIPSNLVKRALDRLYRIHTSASLEDLRTPPSNHLEKLQSDREGQYSIRINQQYRICFYWTKDNNAIEVEIID